MRFSASPICAPIRSLSWLRRAAAAAASASSRSRVSPRAPSRAAMSFWLYASIAARASSFAFSAAARSPEILASRAFSVAAMRGTATADISR